MTEGLRFLPPQLYQSLLKLDYSRLYEVRVRADKPVRVCYSGEFFYLSSQGLSRTVPEAGLKLTAPQISEIILRAAEFSIYAVNNQISGGYITVGGGVRIGVAGEIVYENDKVKTQKNFGSLVIRIPHEIKGSADLAYKSLQNSSNKNMLLISPPGCGKTTILRDLTRRISNNGDNVLLVDERNEIAASQNGIASLDVGINTDIINNARKDYAFTFGIRSLRPDYIVTDELASLQDIEAVKKAALSGVNVIASLHAEGLADIKSRQELEGVITNKIFGRYVFLSLKKGAGTYEKILDSELKALS